MVFPVSVSTPPAANRISIAIRDNAHRGSEGIHRISYGGIGTVHRIERQSPSFIKTKKTKKVNVEKCDRHTGKQAIFAREILIFFLALPSVYPLAPLELSGVELPFSSIPNVSWSMIPPVQG